MMEKIDEFFDAEEQTPETIVKEEPKDVDDELVYEEIEYLEEDEIILARDSNSTLSIFSSDHEAVDDVPLQSKITLANLHEALALQPEQANPPSNIYEVLAMQPEHAKSPSNQRQYSRPKRTASNIQKRRSSRIAKKALEKDSNKTMYPTAKGSNKQIENRTTHSPQVSKSNPRKRTRSRSSSRTARSTTKKAKSRSRSRKANYTAKKASSTAKKARSSSRRSRAMKK